MGNAVEVVQEFHLAKNGRTFFDEEGVRYVVPIYQRAFAWGATDELNRENELVQLVHDMLDFGKSGSTGDYYLGSLVVRGRDNGDLEVIDGQQRLTALYVLFACLGFKIEKPDALVYESRDWSTETLRRLTGQSDKVGNDDETDSVIYEGYRTIERLLASMADAEKKLLKDILSRVVLFRIHVPVGTDLNHYFEIMNTRGEQLEPQDIVKAKLMQSLSDCESVAFARVWDVCSDMRGYVQTKFTKEERERLFGAEWNECPRQIDVSSAASESMACKDLAQLLTATETEVDDVELEGDDDNEREGSTESRARFFSIIDFPHFLMHVLRVLLADGGRLSGGELDDKNLIREFETAITSRKIGETELSARDFSWRFLECLLACRFLFDKYVVKRESATADANHGAWSLKALRRNRKSAQYDLTQSADGSTEDNCALRMMESCLRVSYTSPKTMHWITELLALIFKNRERVSLGEVLAELEIRAARSVKSEYLDIDKTCRMGLATPRIVFNYLDYLLWKRDRPVDFAFEFRNSIEHWYPQHPERTNMVSWDKTVTDETGTVRFDRDRLGNLCLLTTRMNSRFSNLPPESKATYYGENKGAVSLKYAEMRKLTLALSREQGTSQAVCQTWREKTCEEHERAMLEVIQRDLKTKKERLYECEEHSQA